MNSTDHKNKKFGIDAAQAPHFCGRRYELWECQTARPRLEALGYTWCYARTSEADSFGPLGRIIVVSKDGKRYACWYG